MNENQILFAWGDDKRYNSYKHFLSQRFGGRIQKLSLNAGFTCPNRDGTVGWNGCTYCLNDAFNPSYCNPLKSISQQLDEGIDFHRNRYRRSNGYFAYFQAFSNTYSSLETLKKIYQPALEHPLVKGIVIGTRPDCLDEEKISYFADLQKRTFVSIELGIESTSNETLKRINRGHNFETAQNIIRKCAEKKIHTGVHLIFGLPKETPKFWLNEVRKINELEINSIKFHQLQIIKGTKMEEDFKLHPSDFYPFVMETYTDFIVEYISLLNPAFVIERFAGEVPPHYLAVNQWGLIRYDVVLQKIEKKMEQKNTWQGKAL
jgi:radical SAM protein (TIGR01212 family)